MPTFQDNQGRTWSIKAHAGNLRRVRDLLGIDLAATGETGGRELNRLADDPVLLVNAIYIFCQPQIEAAGVSDEEFGRSLGGDAIEDATRAMLDALTAFHGPKKREAIIKATNRVSELRAKAERRSLDKIADPALREHARQQLEAQRIDQLRAVLKRSQKGSV